MAEKGELISQMFRTSVSRNRGETGCGDAALWFRAGLWLKAWVILLFSVNLSMGGETPPPLPERIPESISLGVYSSEKPTEAARRYLPLTRSIEEGLKRRLGRHVSIHLSIVSKYRDASRFLKDAEVDFVEIGAATYVQARKEMPSLDLLAVRSPQDSTLMGGVICVAGNSRIQKVEDLRGRKMAFVDELSTTGHFMSQDYLMRRGILARDLRGYEYLGTHDNVARAVVSGEFDAGAVNEEAFRKVNADSLSGSGKPALRSICRFRNFARPWVARGALPSSLREALKETLISIQDHELLSVFGERDMVMLPAADSDYDPLRKAIQGNESFFRKGSDPD